MTAGAFSVTWPLTPAERGRRYRGRRARRAAFYARRRVTRVLERIVASIALSPAFEEAARQMVITGVGVLQVGTDGHVLQVQDRPSSWTWLSETADIDPAAWARLGKAAAALASRRLA